MIAGLVVMRRPGESLLAVILILGVWSVVSGLVEAIKAITISEGRGLRLVVATADIVLGGLILALPDLSLTTIALLAGLSFIARGIFSIYVGLGLRSVAGTA